MPWSGGVFTRTDGTRTGQDVWKDAKAAAVKIVAADHDTHDQDIGTAINNTLTKDGQNTAAANLPMGGFRQTGVGNASARNQYASAAQVQDGSVVYAAAGGTVDVITMTLSPAITAYATGQRFVFIAAGDNTGAVTLNVNAVGAAAVQKAGSALVAADIKSGAAVTVIYDGTQFQLDVPVALGALAQLDSVAAGQIDTDAVDTAEIAAGAVDTAELAANAVDGTKIAIGSDAIGDIMHYDGTDWVILAAGTDGFVLTAAGAAAPAWAAPGCVQAVHSETTAIASSTTQIPMDDTIPDIAEGVEILTQAITPLSATNRLLIEVTLANTGRASTNSAIVAALFQDATASALAAVASEIANPSEVNFPLTLRHEMAAGTTSTTTLRVRFGPGDSAQAVYCNSTGGAARIFGGVSRSSLRITEYSP